MSLPGNGIFVVQGEMAMLVTAMRRSTRWGSHSFPNEEYDVLMRTFQDLKTILNQVDDLRLIDPPTYLGPFLEVIRSKETTGPVTSLALSAIHKFLSYGLIDPTHPSVPATVEDIADAVTHARFVGTDHSSDGVVLMKILQVLRTLMLSPEGAMLTDESVCEIMLSCFRICFETRLTELLRRNAEQCLRDMTQLIFMRLPQFPPEHEAAAFATAGLSLKKRDKGKRRGTHSTNSLERKSSITEPASPAPVDPDVDAEAKKAESLRHSQDKNLINEAEITIEPVEQIKSPAKKHARHSSMDLATTGNTSISQLLEKCVSADGEGQSEEAREEKGEEVPESDPEGAAASKPEEVTEKLEEYVNHRGIRFTPHDESHDLQPYGLVCVRELFRFLISLCNPLDPQNTSGMVHLGLALAGTALEVGADHVADYPSLLYLVKDPLCRNLLSLLNTERISIFALDLQITFLLFEALRFHLKFQMEAFFKKIIEIISTDISKANYELKEIQHLSLESLAQIFRIPGLCNELYLNYDCDVYCMNVFEEMTKLLSKNVVSSTAYNIHSLSLEALMTIIEAIEMSNPKESETEVQSVVEEKERGRCGHVSLELGGMDDVSSVSDHVTHDISQYFGCGRTGRHKIESDVPSEAELDNIRNMKKVSDQLS
ncbi:Golgi-specific brefeldin A-resistance guanine nucleotide exchange factor 1-like [Choristoneura fumiferana]|uniref:Golgi-specific brefeldin A-resistance guanine nucleotide exchange factor 1-like n=1 Tax=Choristoneura fumiferana TaxID=7141 RepID=UPI003D15B70D